MLCTYDVSFCMYSHHTALIYVSLQSYMYASEEECVEDGGEVTMNMYIEGTDEQNDIEDLAKKCCRKVYYVNSCAQCEVSAIWLLHLASSVFT